MSTNEDTKSLFDFFSQNLLPLLRELAALLTSLYFPLKLTKERAPVGVSGIITRCQRCLGQIISYPEVGYTTALCMGLCRLLACFYFAILIA
jgi:hypothetical protein